MLWGDAVASALLTVPTRTGFIRLLRGREEEECSYKINIAQSTVTLSAGSLRLRNEDKSKGPLPGNRCWFMPNLYKFQ